MIYTWTNPEKTFLSRSAEDGSVAIIPADPANRDYAEFLSSGATAAEYVEPEPPAPPTPAEKLAAAGLTVDELKELLGL
jgi:hypothetical protein